MANTIIKKITVGTPVRKVVGAQAQNLADLLDMDVTDPQEGDSLNYNAATAKWENSDAISGGFF
jgi:hypothetical protein